MTILGPSLQCLTSALCKCCQVALGPPSASESHSEEVLLLAVKRLKITALAGWPSSVRHTYLVEETKGICLDMHNTVPEFNHNM